MEDEVLNFNFGDVEPATFGSFVAMPKGEYNLQCTSVEKFYAKSKQTGQPDPSKPGLRFNFIVTNHPVHTGVERSLWHVFPQTDNKDDWKYLLNTLMCLIPDENWQRDGIQMPLSKLFSLAQGRPVNGSIDWEINTVTKDGVTNKYVNNKLQGLKKFDPGITQPTATEGNPPILTNDTASPTAQAASAGVSQAEVQGFLNEWPGATSETSSSTTPAPSTGASDFGLEPF